MTMSMDWYEKESWYAPLQREETVAEQMPEPRKKKKPRKGLRAWHVLTLLGVLAALIVASSLLFSGGEQPSAAIRDKEPDEMPKRAEDFFKSFYDGVESDTVVTKMPRDERSFDFSLELKDAGTSEELSLQELYERCANSIVVVTGTRPLGGVWGSGIILSEDGLILTNCHVVENCTSMEVTLWDDRSFEAKLVGADAITDLAVLSIEARDLPAAVFGDSGALEVGERVAAIGNPLGASFRSTLTDGIISGIERGVPFNGHSLTMLQTNTVINEGSSGGALFNMYGQVVGVTNMKFYSAYYAIEGTCFAIPSTTVYSVVNDLLASGTVQGRTAIGITVGEIPAQAKQAYELPDGLYVSAVVKGSDAEAKGIRVGDVITAVDGTPVTTLTQISRLKEPKQVGDTMTFTLWREGNVFELEVRLMDQDMIYPN